MSILSGVDFRAVHWPLTLRLHLLRSVAAGIIWAILMLLLAGVAGPWWVMPVMLPFTYFVGLPLYLLMAQVASAFGDLGRAFAGFVVMACALGIVVGDPLVYLLARQRADLVPVEHFRLLNPVAILFVTRAPASRRTADQSG